MSGLHSTLVSVPKLADTGYTTIFNKTGAAFYDNATTTITTNQPPVMDTERCALTGLCKIDLDPTSTESGTTNEHPKDNEAINSIFDLPSETQSCLWYHAAAGFPLK